MNFKLMERDVNLKVRQIVFCDGGIGWYAAKHLQTVNYSVSPAKNTHSVSLTPYVSD